MMSLIETNWSWFIAVLVLGGVALYFDKFNFFVIFMLAIIVAKIVEVQNYHLNK